MIIAPIQKSQNILIASHVQPDGDALGSLLALGLALLTFDKNITFYNESPVPAIYRFLPESERIINHLTDSEWHQFDLAIILDCSDLSRVGQKWRQIEQIPMVINIDHHYTNTGFGQFQWVDITACATAELVYRIIKELQAPISSATACSIFTAILTDTGSFRFENTNQQAFAICSEMVAIGVDPHFVAQHVFWTFSLGRIKLLNRVVDSMEVSHNGQLSIMCLNREMLDETGTHLDDIDGLLNYAKHIGHVKVAALIQEAMDDDSLAKGDPSTPYQYHVSLRSNGSVNVARLAQSFGGGGHVNAAGFSSPLSLDKVKSLLFQSSVKF